MKRMIRVAAVLTVGPMALFLCRQPLWAAVLTGSWGVLAAVYTIFPQDQLGMYYISACTIWMASISVAWQAR